MQVPDSASIAVRVAGNLLQFKQDPFTGEMLAVSSARWFGISIFFRYFYYQKKVLTLMYGPQIERDQGAVRVPRIRGQLDDRVGAAC